MKRYINRLQRVLDIRRIQEEQAKAEVMASRHAAAVAEVAARQRSENYARREITVGAVPFIHHRMDRTLHELQALAVLDAEERVVVAHQQVVRSLTLWSSAARRVEALERLDERRREEHQIEADREAEREVDDLVTGRAGRLGRDELR
jgi:flagellar export protein FliJ